MLALRCRLARMRKGAQGRARQADQPSHADTSLGSKQTGHGPLLPQSSRCCNRPPPASHAQGPVPDLPDFAQVRAAGRCTTQSALQSPVQPSVAIFHLSLPRRTAAVCSVCLAWRADRSDLLSAVSPYPSCCRASSPWSFRFRNRESPLMHACAPPPPSTRSFTPHRNRSRTRNTLSTGANATRRTALLNF